MPKPNLFLMGAPKCGTTTIASWLKEHPKVFVPEVKEPNFFNKDHKRARRLSYGFYLRLYEQCLENMPFLLDGTVWYLYSNVAANNILHFNPDSLFIVCIRNPDDMALSLYLQLLQSLEEDQESFTSGWELQWKRAQNQCLPKTCQNPERLLYGPVCSLGSQLERLYDRAGKKRVHVVVLDDLVRDPALVWEGICRFLGLETIQQLQWRIENPASGHRSRCLARLIRAGGRLKKSLGIWHSFGLGKWNVKPIKKPEIPADFRMEMIDYFSREVSKLECLLGRSLAHWTRKEG